MLNLPLSDLLSHDEDFAVLETTPESQLATMTLKPGEDSGQYGNEHPTCDQIMVVLDGEAEATVNGEEAKIGKGGTLLIKAGADHQIRNRGNTPLKTLNIYAPPAYDDKGEPL
jgi:mannose-6-phosphate isomerase-like protein (cupin superfamily)